MLALRPPRHHKYREREASQTGEHRSGDERRRQT